MANLVETSVRNLKPGDVLRGQIVKAVSLPAKDRHINRYVCRVQFEGQDFSRAWNADTRLRVERAQLP